MSTRVAIVGTAQSWRLTQWTDPGLEIFSLNDAARLPGFQRADRWYDLHPLDHFWSPPPDKPGTKVLVYAHHVPWGYYVRPADHRDWLATQTCPVYLHPEYAQQWPAAATWPTARPFPKADIEAHFGQYFTSTPAWMFAHALMEGATEIQVYGIHLSTEAEYIDQRPNFEFLAGCLLGSGKRTLTVKGELRWYESPSGTLVLPVASPVLSAKFQYAFEPSPRRALDPLRWELHKAQVKQARTIEALKNARFGFVTFDEPQTDGTIKRRSACSSTLREELWEYEILVADCQDQLQRASLEL